MNAKSPIKLKNISKITTATKQATSGKRRGSKVTSKTNLNKPKLNEEIETNVSFREFLTQREQQKELQNEIVKKPSVLTNNVPVESKLAVTKELDADTIDSSELLTSRSVNSFKTSIRENPYLLLQKAAESEADKIVRELVEKELEREPPREINSELETAIKQFHEAAYTNACHVVRAELAPGVVLEPEDEYLETVKTLIINGIDEDVKNGGFIHFMTCQGSQPVLKYMHYFFGILGDKIRDVEEMESMSIEELYGLTATVAIKCKIIAELQVMQISDIEFASLIIWLDFIYYNSSQEKHDKFIEEMNLKATKVDSIKEAMNEFLEVVATVKKYAIYDASLKIDTLKMASYALCWLTKNFTTPFLDVILQQEKREESEKINAENKNKTDDELKLDANSTLHEDKKTNTSPKSIIDFNSWIFSNKVDKKDAMSPRSQGWADSRSGSPTLAPFSTSTSPFKAVNLGGASYYKIGGAGVLEIVEDETREITTDLIEEVISNYSALSKSLGLHFSNKVLSNTDTLPPHPRSRPLPIVTNITHEKLVKKWESQLGIIKKDERVSITPLESLIEQTNEGKTVNNQEESDKKISLKGSDYQDNENRTVNIKN